MYKSILVALIVSFSYFSHGCSVTLSGTMTESEVISALGSCDEIIIADGTSLSTNGDWDLSSLGVITITIQGSGSLVINGNGNNSDSVTLADGSSIVIEDTSNTNALSGGTSGNNPRITIGSTNYYVSDYSGIIAAGGVGPAATPVVFGDITIDVGDLRYTLRWETYSEISCERFDVQYSSDLSYWKNVGSVKGGGNNHGNSYLFRGDYTTNEFYIRLKQIDFNGNFGYSKILSSKGMNRDLALMVYPTVTTNVLNINGTNDVLNVVDNQGRKIHSVKGSGTLDVSRFQAGRYYVIPPSGTAVSFIKK